MNIQVNKNKKIGQVIYIVEGELKEFTLLKHIFTKIFDYDFIEVHNEEKIFYTFKSKNDRNSQVCIIKSLNSNISSITSADKYLDIIYGKLVDEYDFDVENASIYYIFDRDRESNRNPGIIKDLICKLKNSRDNGVEMNGVLLLSYPALESFIITCFERECCKKFETSRETKKYLGDCDYQQNKITAEHIVNAISEMVINIQEISHEELTENDLDDFAKMNLKIFGEQERNYHLYKYYYLLSLLCISFLDLGLFTLEDIEVSSNFLFLMI